MDCICLKWQIADQAANRAFVASNWNASARSPCAVMQNRKPDDTGCRRWRDAGQAANFFALKLNQSAGRWYFVSGDSDTIEAPLQRAVCGRTFYRFLSNVASLIEGDGWFEPGFERQRPLISVCPNKSEAIFNADSLKSLGIQLAYFG